MNDSFNWGQEFKAALVSWVEARLYVAVGYVLTLALVDRFEPSPAFAPVEDGLIPWDGTWYRDLALFGYDAPELEGGMRFFPLWPLLGRLLGSVGDRPDIALVVAANLLALVAGMLIYRLAMQETRNRAVSRSVVRIFSLFPSAFVLVLGYSEALFLALALGLVLCLRARNYWAALVLGFLAGLTRPVASILALPAAVNVWRNDRRSAKAWLSVASAPLGTFTFLFWAERAHGGWQTPIDAQQELRGAIREPITRIFSAFVDGFAGDWGELLHAGAAVLLVCLMVVAVYKLSIDLWVFCVPSTLLLFAADNLNSMERYALAVFPLLIAAGVIGNTPLLRRWLPTVSAVGLTALTTLALSGVYVP